ncbi:uncharacterized protein LOC116200547 [Punica granatum]|uniref:Uncharacterized protein LOC116200547 n=2 Tax=Punica granatum TaxID=22663 RepID=A0A6P8D0S5_PUNGR|nr:uncharacterized protein LOC116200547 [Punica granatum]PKI77187.1 hypothetical protein CRG98_002397 [Punica granatum]
MGNAVSPCFHPAKNSESVKLIFWEGTVKTLSGGRSKKSRHIAGEVMFEFPDKMVCHADSFYLGRPIPSLSIDDEFVPGQAYFVLPIDFFPPSSSPSSCSGYILSASTLAILGSSSVSPKRALIDFGEDGPFQYVKGEDGRLLMKVSPDFIMRIITKGKEGDDKKDRAREGGTRSSLCSTPELRKQYEQLVGCREQVWSPKLETISEHKIRHSPCRFIRLERKQKEKGN